ncbi:Chemotaxis phosphatase, CheZ [Candidatus Magnetoovum chiemensis]|nr:Chemotaxis phosphatase, CheZ [Candidatus Magnetoovum chiemensis]
MEQEIKLSESIVASVKDAMKKNTTVKRYEDDIINVVIDDVQKLVQALSSGNVDDVIRYIEALSSHGEKELFDEVGKLTRKIHDSVNDFKTMLDPRLKTIAQNEMSEATDRLQWVIDKIDEAANKTISLAERTQSRIEGLSDSVKTLEDCLMQNGISSEKEITAISNIRTCLSEVDNDLIDVMVTQEFQDITGQILKKVIKLVSELEGQLVQMVKAFGSKGDAQQPIDKEQTSAQKELPGPQIKTGENVVSNQEDVDALLSELGF